MDERWQDQVSSGYLTPSVGAQGRGWSALLDDAVEEIAVSQRCAEELANVHDELGVMFEQEAEMEGRKFGWRPRSRAMRDSNESSPLKTTANDEALARLMAQTKAA